MKECANWYRSAAEHGNASAMGMLAHLYLVGYGVLEDLNESRRWAEMALAHGNESAKDTLEPLEEQLRKETEAKEIQARKREKFDRDLAEYRKFADAGDARSQEMAGLMFCLGDPPRDRRAGLQYLRLASQHGYDVARIVLANYLSSGTPEEQLESTLTLVDGAEAGDPACQHELGLRYLEGKFSLTQNFQEAAKWFERAYLRWPDSA